MSANFKTDNTPEVGYQDQLYRLVVTMNDLSSVENKRKAYLWLAGHLMCIARGA